MAFCNRHRMEFVAQLAAWFVLLIYLTPLMYMLFRSFIWVAPLKNGNITHWNFTLEHYQNIFKSAGFFQMTCNSILVLIAVVSTNVVFALLAGYAFSRYRFRGQSILFGGLLITMIVPKQILMIPILDLMVQLGLYDTLWALILPFSIDGFNVFFFKQFIAALPTELEEAARSDGANELQVIMQVIFPLCRPAIAVVVINTAVVTWNAFLFPLILTDSLSARTLPVGLALVTQGPYATDWGALMAGSTIVSLPLIMIFWYFQNEMIEGLTAGAFRE